MGLMGHFFYFKCGSDQHHTSSRTYSVKRGTQTTSRLRAYVCETRGWLKIKKEHPSREHHYLPHGRTTTGRERNAIGRRRRRVEDAGCDSAPCRCGRHTLVLPLAARCHSLFICPYEMGFFVCFLFFVFFEFSLLHVALKQQTFLEMSCEKWVFICFH